MVKWADRYSALRLALRRAVCVGESKVNATSRAHVSAISSEDKWESKWPQCVVARGDFNFCDDVAQ